MFKLLALLPVASAHFLLVWPERRGFDDDKAVNFPCGGFDTVTTRTPFPLSGGPIQLDMHHTDAKVQVNMALGNGDGSYSIALMKPVQEEGPNNFCIGDLTFPSNLNLTEGQNATIQVITNGDPDGGLYQCADITFTSTPLSSDDYKKNCQNSTGVSVTSTSVTNVNGTGSTGGSTSASGTASGAAASATHSHSASAPQAAVAQWALGAVGALGLFVAL